MSKNRAERERYPVEEIAEMIFEHIPADGEAPKTRICIAGQVWESRSIRLSYKQVARGLSWIRREHPAVPLIAGRDGVQFTTDRDTLRAYMIREVGRAGNSLGTLFDGTVEPLIREYPPLIRETIAVAFSRAREDLERLVRTLP